MAFDNQTRNRLQRMVTQCRQILAEEFTSQLQGTYGIQPDGSITNLNDMSHLDDDERITAGLLQERIKHIESSLAASKNLMKEAVERLVREQSFTILNRFAAMRMAEERGIILESIANGMNSRGFKVYEQTSGRALGTAYERYRTFVYCIWDEISIDLGALFDRFSPYGLLFPREKSLEKLFEVLNDREIAHLWKEDETIGWIYQYFNSKEEREAMRRASQAPRNSRELAVRNQFFTPRYVVEFLTDNTLGRIWYEMTHGNTRLKELCRYMVRRPNEIFLNNGEEPPERQDEEQEKTQEELLREPVYIPFRQVKDPREILMLDPACGSMHFGLYAFDLYEAIYEEAWDNYPGLLSDLRQKVSGKEEFLRLVPELIIRFNIHGIDIDHRAVQIANLSLWLRAQKSWKKQELKLNQRPTITRSNVVCAESMPGEKQFLEEFTASLQPPVLGKLVKVIWEKMQFAGEAGALLKIEEEISSAIEEAKREWTEIKAPFFQKTLFKEFEMPMQKEFKFPVYDVEEDFWQEAEKRVIDALKEFSEKAVSGQSYQRQMFSEDVVQGFSFIDICRKKYDVVLMNPPFGKYPKISEKYIKIEYEYGWIDCLSSFILRVKSLLIEIGMLGAITSRTFLHLSRLTNLRKNTLIKNLLPLILIDLGSNVLDKAAVETCATIFQNINRGKVNSLYSMFIDIKEEEAKQKLKKKTKSEWEELLSKSKKIFLNDFLLLPYSVFAYDIDDDILRIFKNSKKDFFCIAKAYPGMTTLDNERFLRLTCEIPFKSNRQWKPFSKGGKGKAFYQEFSLNVKWSENGKEVKAKAAEKGDSPSRFIASEENYFKPGLTYPRVGNNLSVRVLPRGCIFAEKGISIFLKNGQKDINLLLGLLMFLNTCIVQKIVELTSPNRFWESGSINKIPIKNDEYLDALGEFGRKSYELVRAYYLNDELSRFFININFSNIKQSNLEELIIIAEKIVRKNYGIEEQFNYNSVKLADDKYYLDKNLSRTELISYVIGLIFGRWDIRIAVDSSLAPELPGPFDPLPVCPPGMLVGTDGLPAKPGGIVSEEWLRARPNAITLTPDDSVKDPTVTDDEYPLRISWDGILVDDSTAVSGQSHPEDIVHRVREVLNLLWKDKAFEIEQEICDILEIKDLETYFQRPAGFFQDHLKRYSKSRRQAPIYWPLSTPSGSYTLWIYYHHLNDQTLYKCINDFIEPKTRETERIIDKKRAETGEAAGLLQKQELEKDMYFLQELKDFKNELIRIAELPYKPNLNDGVLITAAPLYNLFRLPKWKKDLKTCWEKLENGEYDWAHLALAIWYERVKEKCKTDKSFAIAHDLESLYQEPQPQKKKSNRQR